MKTGYHRTPNLQISFQSHTLIRGTPSRNHSDIQQGTHKPVVSLAYCKTVLDGGHVPFSHVLIKVKGAFVWTPFEGCKGLTIDPVAARWMKCGSFDFTDDEAEMEEQFDADDEMSN
ncbi:hypothetical protein CFIO01_13231 [Colletotrichum fioriniae PJ7]|uniref:Uncharacterized protein n=1 Tax=Colletotrichum fioriniae PJ7 TaxID=1445577 RepID=A0A010R761_9PEZI|nr:hypothetical protein CFIO01_13231 [Colletotrichum fioriniae PJ7]